MRVSFTLNRRGVVADIAPGETMLPVLRRLGAKSVKDGCANGDCGTCAILVNGKAVNACLLLAAKSEGSEVVTVEGLESNDHLHPVQVALLDHGGTQCGFCVPGMLMTVAELLAAGPAPESEIRATLAANLCRCTGYVKQIEAFATAGGADAAADAGEYA